MLHEFEMLIDSVDIVDDPEQRIPAVIWLEVNDELLRLRGKFRDFLLGLGEVFEIGCERETNAFRVLLVGDCKRAREIVERNPDVMNGVEGDEDEMRGNIGWFTQLDKRLTLRAYVFRQHVTLTLVEEADFRFKRQDMLTGSL